MFDMKVQGSQFYSPNNRYYSFEFKMDSVPVQINMTPDKEGDEKYCILERGYSTGDNQNCAFEVSED